MSARRFRFARPRHPCDVALRRPLRAAAEDLFDPRELEELSLRHGFDPVTMSRWAGHARTSMSLDVYGHVVLDPREDEWRDFWGAVYDATRRRGVAPVWHEEGPQA